MEIHFSVIVMGEEKAMGQQGDDETGQRKVSPYLMSMVTDWEVELPEQTLEDNLYR